MESPLSHFKFAHFQFSLKAVGCIRLPVYKGPTLRGAFGRAFKKVVCTAWPTGPLPHVIITLVGKHGSKRYGIRVEKGNRYWIGEPLKSHLSFGGFVMAAVPKGNHARDGTIFKSESQIL